MEGKDKIVRMGIHFSCTHSCTSALSMRESKEQGTLLLSITRFLYIKQMLFLNYSSGESSGCSTVFAYDSASLVIS